MRQDLEKNGFKKSVLAERIQEFLDAGWTAPAQEVGSKDEVTAILRPPANAQAAVKQEPGNFNQGDE